jgi:hypothetical protein
MGFTIRIPVGELRRIFGISVQDSAYGILSQEHGLRVYSMVTGATLDVVPAGLGTTDF